MHGICTKTNGKFSSSSSFFSYLIENEVCYLVMCDKMFSKRSAFTYLEDLSQEFHKNYGRKVNTVTRPYAFIEFDVYIQKSKKNLTDRRRNINNINTQLQDVQRIMVNWKIVVFYGQMERNVKMCRVYMNIRVLNGASKVGRGRTQSRSFVRWPEISVPTREFTEFILINIPEISELAENSGR